MDTDTGIGGRQDDFPSTQLSLLEAASADLPNEALERLIALYWKPVYRFIRIKFGKNNEDAKDLTQSFFTTALQRDFFVRFDAAIASFRTYIRMAVDRFAASQHLAEKRQKRGGGIEFESLTEDAATTESPEQAFEREWQRQLFRLALEDLRAHCEASGKLLQFCIFEDYDLASGERPSYSDLATRYRTAETSVTNHLAWARRTLREYVNERLRGVTSGERELHKEMQRLWN